MSSLIVSLINEAEALMCAYFDAFNRHDLDGMLATVADGVAHDIKYGGMKAIS